MTTVLPDDIIYYVLQKIDTDPITFLNFRNINKLYRSLIDNFQGLYINKEICYEEEINILCKKHTSLHNFEWLMKNNVRFSLNNLKNLIIANRSDVIIMGSQYQELRYVLFNRFYIHTTNTDIFSLTECSNPLVIAGMYNRIEIIQYLLENNPIDNPYIHIIGNLLDISIKYNHKNLLSYLVLNQYASIHNIIQNKIVNIIYRIDNSEDILFYLFQTKNITITLKILIGFISNNYNDIFKFCYTKELYKTNFQLIVQCIESNNVILFNYLLENDFVLLPSNFTRLFFQNRKKKTNEFIYNLINNHIHLIQKDSPLIHLCLENRIYTEEIIQLIKKNFTFTIDDMKLVLDREDIPLLACMCQHYTE